MRFSFLLSVLVSAIAVLAHPPVSNPRVEARDQDLGGEDLYALRPDERPLHTTVLMAMATGRGPNVDLR
jgi:hypothetical protein